jgi:hypothetical protein
MRGHGANDVVDVSTGEVTRAGVCKGEHNAEASVSAHGEGKQTSRGVRAMLDVCTAECDAGCCARW